MGFSAGLAVSLSVFFDGLGCRDHRGTSVALLLLRLSCGLCVGWRCRRRRGVGGPAANEGADKDKNRQNSFHAKPTMLSVAGLIQFSRLNGQFVDDLFDSLRFLHKFEHESFCLRGWKRSF